MDRDKFLKLMTPPRHYCVPKGERYLVMDEFGKVLGRVAASIVEPLIFERRVNISNKFGVPVYELLRDRPRKEKLHPADRFALDCKRTAVKFTAYLFAGYGHKYRSEHKTLDEARSAAQALANEHRRGAMIFAVTEHGRSAMIEGIDPEKRRRT